MIHPGVFSFIFFYRLSIFSPFWTATVIEFNSPLMIAPCNKQLNSLFPSSIIKKYLTLNSLVQNTRSYAGQMAHNNGCVRVWSVAAPPLQLKPSEMYIGLVCNVWLLKAIFVSLSLSRLSCVGAPFKDMHQIFVMLFASQCNQWTISAQCARFICTHPDVIIPLSWRICCSDLYLVSPLCVAGGWVSL